MKGRGATRKDGTKGDLLVTVQVVVPDKLTSKAKEAVEAFRDATVGDDPRAGLLTKNATSPAQPGQGG